MKYLNRTIFKALNKNENLEKSYISSFMKEIENLTEYEIYIKMINFDDVNRSLIADELGVSKADFDKFLDINKAIFNGSKVEKSPLDLFLSAK